MLRDFLPSNTIIKCINLKKRKDKKQYMKKQAKRKNFDISFYTAESNKDPKRGCLESHCNVIESLVGKKHEAVLILEDDAHFIKPLKKVKIPEDWDMLYLGGNVKFNMGKYDENWTRIVSWCTHAYIVNLKNRELVEKILESRNQEKEIDTYYIENIHPFFNCYMITPMVAIQKEGYSDIENANVSYNFMSQTLEGFSKPQHKEEDGNYRLILPHVEEKDLPHVSILTPTYKRRKYFSLPIYCFMNFIYPKDKIEWIIVEEEGNDNETVKDMVQFDKRIRYYQVDKVDGKPIPIGKKRNICTELSNHDFILNMDDDDYYPPESILARVKLLMKYNNEIGMVGSSIIGTYDIINRRSGWVSDGNLTIGEASMGYRRSFWEKQKFNDNHKKGEYRQMIEGRFEKIMEIPYYFVVFALNHGENMTISKRIKERENNNSQDEKPELSIYWNEEAKGFINDIGDRLMNN